MQGRCSGTTHTTFKLRGSLDLQMVIVFVLNTPLLGFSSLGSTNAALLSLISVSSGGILFEFVASGSTALDCCDVASTPTGLVSGVLSGIISILDFSVASVSVLFSAFELPICADFCNGSIATGNEPSFCHLVCLFALLVSIRC